MGKEGKMPKKWCPNVIRMKETKDQAKGYGCVKDSGNAYGFGIEFRPGGCYRNLEEKGKESIYWKQ